MANLDATQRRMDLILVLLNASRPITREAIRKKIPLYNQDNDVAFQRMFERDKDDLREMNIPLETAPVNMGFDDEQGYFINTKQWLLPEMNLTTQQRMLITLAASVWQDQSMQAQARAALHNVGGSIQDGVAVNAYVAGQQTNLLDLLDAITNARRVSFSYEGLNSDSAQTRTVDPWRIFLTAGSWYLAGFDLDREDMRTFRLNRIVGAVTDTGEHRDNPAPDELDTRAIVESWKESAVESRHAVLRVAPGKCSNLRLRATRIVPVGDMEELTVTYGFERDLASEIASVCHFVTVASPDSLRTAVSSLVSKAMRVSE